MSSDPCADRPRPPHTCMKRDGKTAMVSLLVDMKLKQFCIGCSRAATLKKTETT